MCNDHSNVLVEIPGATPRGHLGSKRAIDGCIAPLVEALNAVEMFTVSSCCGHGHMPGNIALEDGREIIIVPDWETGRRIDALFPKTVYGEVKS